MDHFYKVARAIFSYPIAAGGAVLHLCADSLKDGLHGGPGRRATAGHQAGTFQRPLLAAGYARSDIQQTPGFHIVRPADSVREMGVSSIYNDVARLQNLQQLVNQSIHRAACLHHQKYLSGFFQRIRQFFQAVAADNMFTGGPPLHKGIHLFRRPVKNRDGKTLGLHIHNQVFAHDRQTDQTDICFFHSDHLSVSSFAHLWTRALPA